MKKRLLHSVLFLLIGFAVGVFSKTRLDRYVSLGNDSQARFRRIEKVYFSDPPPPPHLEDAEIAAAFYAEIDVESALRERVNAWQSRDLHVVISPSLGGYRALLVLPEGVNVSQAEFESLVSNAEASGFRKWARAVIEYEKKQSGVPPVSTERLRKMLEEKPPSSAP